MNGVRLSAGVLLRVVSSIAWYPAFFALAWTVEFAADRDADPVSAIRSLAVVAGIGIGLAVVMRLVVRSTPIAGALACLAMLALLDASTPLTAAVFVVAVILVLVEHRVERRGQVRLPWSRIHEALTVFAAVMLAMTVGNYGLALANRPTPTFDPAWSTPAPGAGQLRNLYVVIVDGHGRQDVLLDELGYDDSSFIAQLEALGFDVSDASHANYLFTRFSLPSFLSGAHLSDLGIDMTRTPDNRLLSAATRDAPAIGALRRLGYEVVGIPSGFDHLGERSAAIDMDTGQMSELEYRLAQTSAVGSWMATVIDEAWLAAGPSRTFASLQRLEALATGPHTTPRATFVHLPLPHPPYGVDAACAPIPLSRTFVDYLTGDLPAGLDAVQLATGPVACVDRILIPALETIVSADPDAILILMSDHGPGKPVDWAAPAQPGIVARAANLFAARTPGHPRLFPDDISLVNVLPRLFNSYFGMSLALRPDDVYSARSEADGTLHRVEWP